MRTKMVLRWLDVGKHWQIFRSANLPVLFALLGLLLTGASQALENVDGIQVKRILDTSTTWNGGEIRYPEGQAHITGLLVEIPVGAETGWHSHPVSSFGVIVEGELEIRLQDGRTKRVKAGEGLAEVISTLHNGKNVGAVPVKLYVFYAGAAGMTLTQKAE